MFARICIDRTFVQRLVRELWRDLLTLIAVAGDLDFSEDKTAQHVTAWQLVGSICTTDTVPKTAKSYDGKAYSYLTRVLPLLSRPAD